MNFPDDPHVKQLEFVVALLRSMTVEQRAKTLEALAEHVCLRCGEDAPCYCAPCYDE